MSLTLTFEHDGTERFVHIWSTNGVLGHAEDVKKLVPSDTWLTLEHPRLNRLTPWLVKKCGFKFVATVFYDHKLIDVLKKE